MIRRRHTAALRKDIMTSSPPDTPPATPLSLSDALNRLWVRFLPDIEGRVSILEAAVKTQADGPLSEEHRGAAQAAAHKLAGTLGTFGLHRGTDLARQIELEFAEEPPHAHAAQLSLWIAELRSVIERRQ
jgi:HPt (histidine-containing phosphotransfer) domain-containing protein